MTYPAYLRERARALRIDKRLTLDEIAERLALPKTTVWYWISDLPLARPRRENGQPGTKAMQAKYQRLREESYEQGRAEYDELMRRPTFRDFVVLYVSEGSKRSRNTVAICNSNELVVAIATSWIRELTTHDLKYTIQYHADQDLDELRHFWGRVLGIDADAIKLQRKSNSGQLRGRTWRCAHGVMTVKTYDTMLRARLQARIDRVHEDWGLDSPQLRGA
jgi:transcriptional regulator with XRE-family HTH domain